VQVLMQYVVAAEGKSPFHLVHCCPPSLAADAIQGYRPAVNVAGTLIGGR